MCEFAYAQIFKASNFKILNCSYGTVNMDILRINEYFEKQNEMKKYVLIYYVKNRQEILVGFSKTHKVSLDPLNLIRTIEFRPKINNAHYVCSK